MADGRPGQGDSDGLTLRVFWRPDGEENVLTIQLDRDDIANDIGRVALQEELRHPSSQVVDDRRGGRWVFKFHHEARSVAEGWYSKMPA